MTHFSEMNKMELIALGERLPRRGEKTDVIRTLKAVGENGVFKDVLTGRLETHIDYKGRHLVRYNDQRPPLPPVTPSPNVGFMPIKAWVARENANLETRGVNLFNTPPLQNGDTLQVSVVNNPDTFGVSVLDQYDYHQAKKARASGLTALIDAQRRLMDKACGIDWAVLTPEKNSASNHLFDPESRTFHKFKTRGETSQFYSLSSGEPGRLYRRDSVAPVQVEDFLVNTATYLKEHLNEIPEASTIKFRRPSFTETKPAPMLNSTRDEVMRLTEEKVKAAESRLRSVFLYKDDNPLRLSATSAKLIDDAHKQALERLNRQLLKQACGVPHLDPFDEAVDAVKLWQFAE